MKLTQPLKFGQPSALLAPAIGSSATASARMTMWLNRFEHDTTEISDGSYHRTMIHSSSAEPLAAEPADPADITKAVTAMDNTIEQPGVDYAAELNFTLGPFRHDLDHETSQTDGMCA